MPYNSAKLETFVRWFLRFNGYFTVENFVVHAADDPARIFQGTVAPYTEVDTLALRMPYSLENKGPFVAANWLPLVSGSNGRHDVVIAEAKAGDDARPNNVWRGGDLDVIKYIVRFVGLKQSTSSVEKVARELKEHYSYEDQKCRFRYAIFSDSANPHYQQKGVSYFQVEPMVRFLAEVRGECWVNQGIGVASVHYQWDGMINSIFKIANDTTAPLADRCERIIAELR